MSNRCSALVGQAFSIDGVCLNGFVTVPACDPVGDQPASCPTCRRAYDRQSRPLCMREEEPAPTWDMVLKARAKADTLTKST